MLVCQDRECGYRETVSRTTNARCPVCHKRMEMIGKGEDATFVCSCGHKERMTKFQERRKKGGGVTKRDVAAYLKNRKRGRRAGKQCICRGIKRNQIIKTERVCQNGKSDGRRASFVKIVEKRVKNRLFYAELCRKIETNGIENQKF